MKISNLFSLFALSLLPTSFSLLLQCTGQVQIYEAYPDYSGAGGSYGFIGKNNGKATSNLCVVDLPPSAAGKTCRLHFSNPYYVDPAGSKRGQIFTLGSPVITGATWNHRGLAFRDQQVGTFIDAAEGTSAMWEGTNTFLCMTGLKGFEVVPTGDSQWISWMVPAGLMIEVVTS
ncbi:hypothetical protein K440DRAFT_658249 [Wilcoxina mikolae CBS 423.85]|nr:hypothetical protein K440DRAFT_658249 [Wilcoxina mikolae CBS 423.85]